MKITISKRHSIAGNPLLVIVVLIAMAAVLWFGGKVIYKVVHWNIDPNRGQEDPEKDTVAANEAMRVIDADPEAFISVAVPSLSGVSNARLPVEMLAYEWEYEVYSSTNLLEWELSPLAWQDAVAQVEEASSNGMSAQQPRLFYKLTVRPKSP